VPGDPYRSVALMGVKITGIQLFLILLTVAVHAMSPIMHLLSKFHRITLYLVDLLICRIFEVSVTDLTRQTYRYMAPQIQDSTSNVRIS